MKSKEMRLWMGVGVTGFYWQAMSLLISSYLRILFYGYGVKTLTSALMMLARIGCFKLANSATRTCSHTPETRHEKGEIRTWEYGAFLSNLAARAHTSA